MAKPLPQKYKLRGSAATYRLPTRKNDQCDLDELAQHYLKIGNIPQHIGWTRACEISLLCSAFLIQRSELKRLRKIRRAQPVSTHENKGK